MNLNIHSSWKRILQKEFDKEYFNLLQERVSLEYKNKPKKIFPKEDLIFNAFNLCPFDQVKVVVLGQDPYPTKGHAHGLCFSVDKEISTLPKSLNNIFKELLADVNVIKPHGSLESWASQGVLLLNSILTVEEGKPESHKGIGWEKFTDEVLNQINTKLNPVVFLLWGKKAMEKKKYIDSKRHLVLESVHPSPLSAYRGFFGCRHFSKTNAFLESHGLKAIRW